MSGVDVEAEMGAELAGPQAEHVALKREHQWLETGRADLAACHAHGLTLRRRHRRLSNFSARLGHGRLSSSTSMLPPAVWVDRSVAGRRN
jgi:hypothetical protein